MTITYDTAGQHRADGFRYWSSLMCRTFAFAEGRALDVESFDARFTANELGPATVCRIAAPQQFWERSARHVRQAPRDEFLLTQVLSGSGLLKQDGRELIMSPGVMALYDTSRPYSYEVGGEVLFVKLTRSRLLAQVAEPRNVATPLGSDSKLITWASNVMQQASRLEPSMAAPAAAQVGSSVVSAVAALLCDSDDQPAQTQVASRNTQLDRVCAHIGLHLGDPSLNLQAIAQAQGLSERTLNRLFSSLGTTPMKWVLQQRLARSLRALQCDAKARVTDIAFTNGFNDLSHFSRVFKKTYAISPQQVHAQRPKTPASSV